jgi:hypothetical protein
VWYGAAMDVAGLFSGMTAWSVAGMLIFSGVGFVAFVYGKKQRLFRPMVLGVALMAYPYFVSNTILLYAIGVALTAAVVLARN